MILLAALLLAAAPAPQAADADGAPAPKMICRRIEITGSIMGGQRLCKTKDAWERWDGGNHDKAQSINDPTRRGYGVSNPNGGPY